MSKKKKQYLIMEKGRNAVYSIMYNAYTFNGLGNLYTTLTPK